MKAPGARACFTVGMFGNLQNKGGKVSLFRKSRGTFPIFIFCFVRILLHLSGMIKSEIRNKQEAAAVVM